MLDIFSGLRLVVKRRSISIDNAIFRCHWFFTSTLLVSFSLIITARQYVGQPIECHSVNKLPDSLLNSYCWVQSTFSVPQACNQQVGTEVPYPCIDNTRGREIKVFAYYQWVGMVLFVQGLLFHLPYYLWKMWENGLIRAITGGLRVAVLSDQERAKKKEVVVDYIHDHLGCHRRYAFKYFLCEFICLVNLLAQLWATDKFFDGQFLRYGLDILTYSSSSLSGQLGLSSEPHSSKILMQQSNLSVASSNLHVPITLTNHLEYQQVRQQQQQNTVDPMTYIFPRITKCTYYDFGSSGDVQKHDALCLLPLNIINEKIYIALWFWFLILALLTVLVIIYRLIAIVSESVRCAGLISRCKLSSERDIRIICRHCDVGDWFLFYMVAENLDPLIMREIVADIATKIQAHFQLKKDLGMSVDDDNSLIDPNNNNNLHAPPYKFKSTYSDRYIQQQVQTAFGESSEGRNTNYAHLTHAPLASSSRRGSVATNATGEEMPLVKKLRKRFASKRLWSIDLSDQRQNLFGLQPPENPDQQALTTSANQPAPSASVFPTSLFQTVGVEQTSVTQQVSAPPANLMPLDAAPSVSGRHHTHKIQDTAMRNRLTLQRRGSLTRTSSTNSSSSVDSSSTSDSLILDMQIIKSDSSSRLDTISTDRASRPATNSTIRRDRFSKNGRSFSNKSCFRHNNLYT